MFAWVHTGEWLRMQDLRTRASADRSCPANPLRLVPLSSGTNVGVDGCAKGATHLFCT